MRFKNYKNPYTNDNRIYSFKDLYDMPFGEVIRNKQEVLGQYRVLGVPTEKELQGSENVIWVEAYTRDDGTEVKGHWRSKPEGSGVNIHAENKSNAVTITGGASEIKKNNAQENNLKEYLQGMFNDYKSLKDPQSTALYVLGEFLTNYNNMKDADTHGADKYFHAKANYEAAQQGIVGSVVAKIISDIREWSDSNRNIKEKKYTPEESMKDIQADQRANEEGRKLGRKYPMSPPYEILKYLMPNGFPRRYRKRW